MPPMKRERQRALAAALRYVGKSSEIELSCLGEGNINDTYLVRSTARAFVLQRINSQVFPRPELVVANFQTVTAHLAARAPEDCFQWRDIHLIPTEAGEPFYKDEAGDVWRSQTYLDKTATFSTIDSPERARQVGLALGHFHRFLNGLASSSLYDTLPGFHVLASYLAHFDRIKDLCTSRKSSELTYCLEMVAKYRGSVGSLQRAEERGQIIPHVIHGDPKASNVLFDLNSGLSVCMIDLDTVRPGLLHYDIGDCLRSCCNPAGETGDDPENVRFEVDLAREILNGYYAGAGSLITAVDKSYIHDAVCLLSFELGLRFLTDFLDGNRYFKVENPDDNIRRAHRQFRLLADLMELGDVFAGIV